MNKTKGVLASIIQKLSQASDRNTKKQLENYFRLKVYFRGVKAPQIKNIFRELWPEIKDLKIDELTYLSTALLASRFSEDKQFGILILNRKIPEIHPRFLEELIPHIDGHVSDWATADSLSSKVIRHLMLKQKKSLREVVSWSTSINPWRQRIAAVSFVNIAKNGHHTKEILIICANTIKSSDRFVQLGTGWLLRELYTVEPEKTLDFIKKNYRSFSREGLRYAIEKMNPKLRKELLDWKPQNQ